MDQKKINDWVKPGIYSGLQKASIPLFGLLSTMLLAHKILSKSDMGVWVLFLVVTSFAELFRSGIVRTSLIKYLNFSQPGDQRMVLSAAFFLNAAITLILCFVLFFGSREIALLLKAPELDPMLRIYVATLFVLIPFSHFEWFMYGKSMFKAILVIYVVRQGSALVGMLIYFLIVGSASLSALVFIYSAGIVLGLICGFYFVKQHLDLRFDLKKNWLLQLWNYGKFVFGSNVGTLIFRNADQFMLSNITANTSLVASQNIGTRIMNIADIPSQVIGDILFPKSSNPDLSGNTSRIKYFYEKAVGASLSFILPFILMVVIFPKPLLFVLAGDKYYDAIPYLRLISITAIFLAFLKQWGVIIDSTGRPQVNFMILMLLAALEVSFCFLFIPHYGLEGAAYSLVSTHFLGFIITQWLLNRYFKISFVNCFKYAFQYYPTLYKLVKKKAFVKFK
ncbi:MAG: oligosaccharide flippase family protein [Ginsengibacter sp.]